MNALVGQMQFSTEFAVKAEDYAELPQAGHVEGTTPTPWGYIVNGVEGDQTTLLRSMLARFVGTILLLAAAGLWLVPDSVYGAEVFVMKLGAMTIFSVTGASLLWFGRRRPGLEVQVDTVRRELRLGNRSISGEFRLLDMLRFDEVGAVYLMRNGAQGQPSRLFLRLGADGNTAIEILRGAQSRLNAVRLRLIEDLHPVRRRRA